MRHDPVIHLGTREISISAPTYFIADIASNHDGDLERAKSLIHVAKEAGADAVKFQHFKAEKIVSDRGFRDLGRQASHQANWERSVFETYRQYECNREWSHALVDTARSAGIDFLTTPYDVEAVEALDEHLPAYKVGSGDITWSEFLAFLAQRGKPVFLATGAASMAEVERAVDVILKVNPRIVIMQCNTNYEGSAENFRFVNLRVLSTYATRYPGMLLGLSDHTPRHAAVLGAIALGARVVEKHLTDDNGRKGPDHPFSMNPSSWREMIERSRELEMALGDGLKRVEANEKETAVVQQRCLRLVADLPEGHVLESGDLEALRPAPDGAVKPFDLETLVGRRLVLAFPRGHAVRPEDLE